MQAVGTKYNELEIFVYSSTSHHIVLCMCTAGCVRLVYMEAHLLNSNLQPVAVTIGVNGMSVVSSMVV